MEASRKMNENISILNSTRRNEVIHVIKNFEKNINYSGTLCVVKCMKIQKKFDLIENWFIGKEQLYARKLCCGNIKNGMVKFLKEYL